jgi:putative cardiolipin synthase
MDVLIKDTKDIKLRTGGTSLTTSIQSYYDKLYYHIGNNHLSNAIVRLSRNAYKKEIVKMSRISRKTINANPKFNSRLNDMIDGDFFDTGFDNGLVRVLNEIQNIQSPWGRIKYGSISKVNPNSITKDIWDQMKKAEHSIEIVTPYAHFTDKEIKYIRDWLKENPNRKFRLLTSSLATNDTVASQSLIDHSLMPKLMKDGDISRSQLEVFFYGREDDFLLGGDIKYGKLHAKYAVFDERKSIVMTSNLDPRSRSLNSEIGVSIGSVGNNNSIASELIEKTDTLIQMSHKYGSKEWSRIDNHENLKWKKVFSKIIHVIVQTFNLERNI